MNGGTGDAGRRTRWAYVLLAVLWGCGGHDAARRQEESARVERGASGATGATGSATSATAGGDAAARPSIVFAGTSVTAGLGLDPDSAYPQLIQRKVDSAGLAFEVVNAGVSGETSAGLLRRLDWLLRDDFAVFVIETGANDGLRGTPVDETKRNIQQIITRIKATHPCARVLLMQMEAPPNLGARYTTSFHDMYPALASANHVQLVPFLLAGVAGHAELNQADGIHPNMRGERIVAANVWSAMRDSLATEARRLVQKPQGC